MPFSGLKALSRSSRQFRLECKHHLISGSVTMPFWIKLPFICIHGCITVDVLHQLYQGIIKYLLTWCSSLMSKSELDWCLQALPQCFDVHHFKCSWSKLTQVSGSERKHMACILLGCLVVSWIDRFSLGPNEEGSKRGRDGSRGGKGSS